MAEEKGLVPSCLGTECCGNTRIRFYMYSGGLLKDGDLREVRGWELEGEHGLKGVQVGC